MNTQYIRDNWRPIVVKIPGHAFNLHQGQELLLHRRIVIYRKQYRFTVKS